VSTSTTAASASPKSGVSSRFSAASIAPSANPTSGNRPKDAERFGSNPGARKYRQYRQEARGEADFSELSATCDAIRSLRAVRAVRRASIILAHPIFSETPALSNVAISRNSASAASITLIASAAPVPSPNRIPRSTIGRKSSFSSASV